MALCSLFLSQTLLWSQIKNGSYKMQIQGRSKRPMDILGLDKVFFFQVQFWCLRETSLDRIHVAAALKTEAEAKPCCIRKHFSFPKFFPVRIKLQDVSLTKHGLPTTITIRLVFHKVTQPVLCSTCFTPRSPVVNLPNRG